MKTIVVGAGPAGLAATYALKQKGVDVLALEAAPQAGGRARGYFKNGYQIDTGAQFASPFYTATIGLMQALGKGDEFKPFHFKSAVWRNGKLYPINPGLHPRDMLTNIPDLLRFRGIDLATILQMIKMGPIFARHFLKVDFKNWDFSKLAGIDHLSVADFTLRHGGRDALENVFQPLTAYMTLGEPEEVSMSHFLAIVGFFVKGVRLLEHGMGEIGRSLSAACGESIRYSTPVKRIVMENGRVLGVETPEGFMDADQVICAVSAGDALAIMPDLPGHMRALLGTVKYSSTCHIAFGLEKKIMPKGWYSAVLPRKAGFMTTGPVESSLKSPHYAPPGAGLVHCLTYGKKAPAYMDTPDEELKKLMIEDLRRILPDFPSNPLMAEVHRWKEAVCLQSPGQFGAVMKLKNEHSRDVKGLSIAGDFMSLFSSVEAAIRSGQHAARQILHA